MGKVHLRLKTPQSEHDQREGKRERERERDDKKDLFVETLIYFVLVVSLIPAPNPELFKYLNQ